MGLILVVMSMALFPVVSCFVVPPTLVLLVRVVVRRAIAVIVVIVLLGVDVSVSMIVVGRMIVSVDVAGVSSIRRSGVPL